MAEEYVSLAELELLDEELVGFNPEADANATIPPPPAATYLARVYYTNQEEPGKIWEKRMGTKNDSTKVYYMSVVTIEMQGNDNELANGRKLSFYPNTLVRINGGGTSSIQQLLQPLGYEDELLKSPRTVGALTGLLTRALSGGQALLAVEIDWEAQYYDKEKDKTIYTFRGMKKFPKDKNGNPEPFIDWPGTPDGEYGAERLPARAYIRRFHPASVVGGANEALTADLEASVQQQTQSKRPTVAETLADPRSVQAPQGRPAQAPQSAQPRPQPVAAPQPRPANGPLHTGASAPSAGGPPVPQRATVTAGAKK